MPPDEEGTAGSTTRQAACLRVCQFVRDNGTNEIVEVSIFEVDREKGEVRHILQEKGEDASRACEVLVKEAEAAFQALGYFGVINNVG